MRNGEISYWMAARPETDQPRRAPLDHDETADVCIVGAGFTGLWTAYLLHRHDPSLDIRVLESERAGYGASGRNDGWISPLLSANRRRLAAAAGRGAVIDFQRAMIEAVGELLDVLRAEGIDAHQRRGGHLRVARTRAARARQSAAVATGLDWGYHPDELLLLDRDETAARIRVAGAVGGLYSPLTAHLDPGLLVTALGRLVERDGTTIHEGTPVASVGPHEARTSSGARLRARWVLVCAEGYAGRIRGMPRLRTVPVNSSIVITEPLSDEQWETIGWRAGECFGDSAHVFTYAQRTEDGRIAIGGRGKPYRYASGIDRAGEVDQQTIRLLRGRLEEYFPAAGPLPVAHAWCGVIGVTRDWCAFVDLDEESGIGSAGGYAGHGVTSAFAAAHTLADRICGVDSRYVRLPWLGHRPPRWEPEPLRWLGITSMYALFGLADAREERAGAERTSAIARLAAGITGMD